MLVNNIEDVAESEKELAPEKEPLLTQADPILKKEPSNPAVNHTITSIDSNFSNSDNCSEIELNHIIDPNDSEKPE